MKMAQKITTQCYGHCDEWDSREQAIATFKEGMANCDPNSSEYSRYATIVAKLESGATFADDRN